MSFYFCICSPSRQRRGGILATPVRKRKERRIRAGVFWLLQLPRKRKRKKISKKRENEKKHLK
jgi:ribosomal protein S7